MISERSRLLPRESRGIRLNGSTKFGLIMILLSQALERISFYSIVGNLVLFLNLNPLDWMSYDAATILFLFMGVSYASSIFGGWIADSFLGKYKTIILFMIIYLIGYSLLPILAFNNGDVIEGSVFHCVRTSDQNGTYTTLKPPKAIKHIWQESCYTFVMVAIVVIGFASGCVKSCMAPFGADQVRQYGSEFMIFYFNWFYWSVNIGGLIALCAVAYVQQEVNFELGYTIPFACLGLSLLCFLIGKQTAYQKLMFNFNFKDIK